MNDNAPRWLAKYGLERDPFPESETPVDFFSRGGREKQMELLADTRSLGRPLVAVVGESGVGKSTFFHNLLRRLPEEARVARVTAGVFLSAKALIQAIARSMGVATEPDEDIEPMRMRLHGAVRVLVATGKPCVVMVDDAGELDPDALAELVALSELGSDSQPVRVILFGQPGLRDALVRATDAQRIDGLIHEMMLDRYSLNELRGYLQFRLARAGLKGASPFSEEDYQDIFRRSGGLPGRANEVAGRMLRDAGPLRLSADHLRWVAGGVAAALVLSAVLLLLFAGRGQKADAPTVAATDPAPGSPTQSAEPSPDPADADAGEPDLGEPDLGEPDLGEPDLATRGLEDSRHGAGAGEPTSPAAGADDGAEPTTENGAGAGEWLPVPEETSEGETGAAEPEPATTPADATMDAGSGSEPVAEPGSEPTDTADPLAEASAEVLALAPDRYVLQVLVSSSAARARDWISSREDPERYRYFRRTREGSPEYVVIHGDYATRAQASAAVDEVAQRTGVDAPWIRRAGDLQEDIAQR